MLRQDILFFTPLITITFFPDDNIPRPPVVSPLVHLSVKRRLAVFSVVPHLSACLKQFIAYSFFYSTAAKIQLFKVRKKSECYFSTMPLFQAVPTLSPVAGGCRPRGCTHQ